MTDPTEQEIEAATRAIENSVQVWSVGIPQGESREPDYAGMARAALTAAAQVRERAGHMPLEPTENMLAAAREWSAEKFGKPIGNDAASGCWRAMYQAAPCPPALMPIYGTTEDQGEDVLGMKGEGS